MAGFLFMLGGPSVDAETDALSPPVSRSKSHARNSSIAQKERRLKDLQKLIDEKKRQIETTEQQVHELKISLEDTQNQLNRSKQALQTTRQKKRRAQRQTQAKSISWEVAVTKQETQRDHLADLWKSYETNRIQGRAQPLEKPRLLAMALTTQAELYQQSAETAGRLKTQVESLKTTTRKLTQEEHERERKKRETLKVYEERHAQYTEVETRKEALLEDIRDLEKTAAQLTQLVNKLRRKAQAAKAAPQGQRPLPRIEEKPPLREASLPWPVSGRILKKFGKSIHPELRTPVVSNGLVIGCAPGSPIRAVAPGKIIFAGSFMSYGRIVLVEHAGDWHSIYGQLTDPLPAIESFVKAGDLLGHSSLNKEGTSLAYFEVRIHGRPVDPLPWLRSH